MITYAGIAAWSKLIMEDSRAGPNIPFNLPIIQNFILQFLPHYSRENHLLFLKNHLLFLKKLTKMQMKCECDQPERSYMHYKY